VNKKKILIADDEPSVRLIVTRMLEKDHIVLEATNGKEAVAIAKGERPALILMDLMMPSMDGYTACSEIKGDQLTKVIPVVMLTAVGHELNKKFAVEMGADGYITKPFTTQELVDVITPLLTEAH
jgi:two-component system alkaline phosphatase synthesis response regulator PhoP